MRDRCINLDSDRTKQNHALRVERGRKIPRKSVATRPSEKRPDGLPGKVIPYGNFLDITSEYLIFPVST